MKYYKERKKEKRKKERKKERKTKDEEQVERTELAEFQVWVRNC